MSTKPSFLSGGASASAPKDPFADRPQKEGSSSDGCDANDENFPNRPQPMGKPAGNPQSVPSGGKLPYGSPPAAPKMPFKLGK